jgi:hypothetical protein
MGAFLTIVYLFTLSHFSLSYSTEERRLKLPDRSNHYSSYFKNLVPIDDEMTFEKFKEVIEKNEIKSLDQALTFLPAEMMNNNYILMYHSRSLQESTPESPRALVFSPSARFILSFNGGDPSLRGANSIEIIQYKDSSRSFEFREIEFIDGLRAKISGPNPKKCMECHQSQSRSNVDLRPNWEPYNIWLGAFGSNSGRVGGTPLKKSLSFKSKIQPQDQELLELQSIEEQMLDLFFSKIQPAHPRYRFLGEFNSKATVALTDHLGVLNFERIVRLMSEEKEIFKTIQPLMFYIMTCRQGEKVFEELPELQNLRDRYKEKYFRSNEVSLSTTNYFITFPFEALGVDTSDWSMDFGTRARFSFRERFGTPSNPERQFRRAWDDYFPDFSTGNRRDCGGLNQFLRPRLKNLAAVQPEPLKISVSSVISRCARCHADEGGSHFAPQIAFNDPLRLKSQLSPRLIEKIKFRTSDMATKSEQMPPSGRLGVEEREALIEYLQNLSKID